MIPSLNNVSIYVLASCHFCSLFMKNSSTEVQEYHHKVETLISSAAYRITESIIVA